MTLLNVIMSVDVMLFTLEQHSLEFVTNPHAYFVLCRYVMLSDFVR